jgi:flagellar motor protein MotB
MRNYQRGVLLGLTLAEVFILLLFIFLISLSSEKKNQPTKDSIDRNTIGVKPPPEITSNDDTFPIPDTSAPLVPDGMPIPEPPNLGVKKSDSQFPKNNDDSSVKDQLGQSKKDSEYKTDTSVANQSETSIGFDANSGKHNWPPIITITEAQGYSFPKGSAFLSDAFREFLTTKVAVTLKENIDRYEANIIEVVGHTDEQPKTGNSNLDVALIDAANGTRPIHHLTTADNVGLGMARALSIVQVLTLCPELSGVKILPYSAGQAIDNSGSLSDGGGGDAPSRRRIEIRLRGI